MGNDELWQKMQPFLIKIDTIAEFIAEQRTINKIMNKKMDMFIIKNEAEHKKFKYDIANLNSLAETV